jgi:hypothetical protein
LAVAAKPAKSGSYKAKHQGFTGFLWENISSIAMIPNTVLQGTLRDKAAQRP